MAAPKGHFIPAWDGGDGAGQADGEMDVVFRATNAIAFTIEIPSDGGEIGVKTRANIRTRKGGTVEWHGFKTRSAARPVSVGSLLPLSVRQPAVHGGE